MEIGRRKILEHVNMSGVNRDIPVLLGALRLMRNEEDPKKELEKAIRELSNVLELQNEQLTALIEKAGDQGDGIIWRSINLQCLQKIRTVRLNLEVYGKALFSWEEVASCLAYLAAVSNAAEFDILALGAKAA